MAWEIATNQSIQPRDLALAEKLATRATEADKGKSPDFIDTLARVLFMRGRKEEAIKLQEQAVTVAEDKRKPSFQKTLDSYRQGILPKPD